MFRSLLVCDDVNVFGGAWTRVTSILKAISGRYSRSILMTVAKSAIEVGVRGCKRVWQQRYRAHGHNVMQVCHRRTCEFVMAAFVVSVGGMITARRVVRGVPDEAWCDT